jgi:hypothetical protein
MQRFANDIQLGGQGISYLLLVTQFFLVLFDIRMLPADVKHRSAGNKLTEGEECKINVKRR